MKPGSTGLVTSIIGILPNQMSPSKRAILPLSVRLLKSIVSAAKRARHP